MTIETLFGDTVESPREKPVGPARHRVLITVKAAPNPSASHGETVCVAGVQLGDYGPTGWIRLVSCVVAHPEACPAGVEAALPEDLRGTARAWRLRGMATDPSRQGQGHGAAVLARMLDELRLRGAAVVWCNARVPAAGLYRRAGFSEVGESWDDPVIGPHVRMWRPVAQRPAPQEP